MIDKLDLRIPSGTPFSKRFESVVAQLRLAPIPPFHPTKRYSYVGDLRHWYDIDAVLHLDYKFGECTHKLEILDAGQKTIADFNTIVCEIFDVDAASLEIMRIDLAADIEGIPVKWFRENLRARFKRLSSRIDKNSRDELEFVGINTADSETFYIGKRPNCFRIYNKIIEMHLRWKKLFRDCERFNRQLGDFQISDAVRPFAKRTPPPFEEFCAYEGVTLDPGMVLTRVERQIAGGRIPVEVATLGDLTKLPDFDPFDSLQILNGSSPLVLADPGELSSRDWLAVKGLQRLIEESGSVQIATSFVRRHSNGNGKRVLDSLIPYLPKSIEGIDGNRLQSIFRASINKQLPNSITDIYLPPRHEKETDIAGASP